MSSQAFLMKKKKLRRWEISWDFKLMRYDPERSMVIFKDAGFEPKTAASAVWYATY